MAINTGRIASLCLPESELHVGVRFDRPVGDAERPAALLYPGPGAVDVEERPPEGPITLVVVDGTWPQAKKLVRESPALASLPRYAFRPLSPSDYRIRREPRDDYVSTLEALVHVLGVLERDRARFEAMLVPFRAMVDAQLEYEARGLGRRSPRRPRRKVPSDPRARLPTLIRERGRDLVCVYGEANAWPHDSPERRAHGDELVQWVACRVATGETFETFVAPRGPIAPVTTHHTGLDERVIASGIDREALVDRWSRFVRAGDVLCTWGSYTAELFASAGGQFAAPRVDLRRAARLFANAKVGELEAFFPRLGIAAPDGDLGVGRAGRRLAQMVALARALAG